MNRTAVIIPFSICWTVMAVAEKIRSITKMSLEETRLLHEMTAMRHGRNIKGAAK